MSKSGLLTVNKKGDWLEMNFPADPVKSIVPAPLLIEAIGKTPSEVYQGKTDYLLLYESKDEILELKPNFYLLKQTKVRGIIATAKGDKVDFVSRFFAPGSGIDEDPATGSAHTTLTPFWSERLSKTTMDAQQYSPRGGVLRCTMQNDRVLIAGKAITYMEGEIQIPAVKSY